MLKQRTYKPNTVKKDYEIFVSKNNEFICHKRMFYSNHYLFQDIGFKFLVPSKNTWDVHPVNFLNSRKSFVILAESARSKNLKFLINRIS